MFDRFTERAKEAIRLAVEAAQETSGGYVGTEHLLLGLVREGNGTAAVVLNSHGITEQRILDVMEKLVSPETPTAVAGDAEYTPGAKKILQSSYEEAVFFKAPLVGTEHILIAIVKSGSCTASRLLYTLNVNLQKLYIDLMGAMGGDSSEDSEDGTASGRGSARAKDKNAGSDTPTLDKYSVDMTEAAREGKMDPVIGRDKEMQRVIQILSRRTKNNPCLIGEPGVGKTAVAEGLAEAIVNGDVPESVADKRLIRLDISSMVAGSKYRGEFEERIKKVIEEVKNAGDILLFIDEIHTIIGAGGAEGAIDASNIMKPSLARGEIQLIGATTVDEYRKRIEKDAALERRFQPVMVDEPEEDACIEILRGLKSRYEDHHQVRINDEAVESAVRLSKRYINDRFLPDKAIDVIDEAASKVRLTGYTEPGEIHELEEELRELDVDKEQAVREEEFERAGEIKKKQAEKTARIQELREKWKAEKDSRKLVVGANEVADVVSEWTGIPVRKLNEGEAERLMKLEEVLHARVVGQNEAVSAVAKAIRRGRVGLKDPKRPIGSFLFLGPTGVGKTELSKTLSESLFGTENAMIRVDMSEYMEKQSVSKIIGSPPGYVGYEEGGQLAEKVRRHPYSVVLFDEIEKAHPDVFNVLLQILDDGHITDAQGRTVDFKNTVIIMTSNAGAANIISPKHVGFASENDEKADYTFMKGKVMDEVKRMFRPEFLNRIDEIIVFHPLTQDDISEITRIMIRNINHRTSAQLDMNLIFSPAAVTWLSRKGYDPKYGARPLRRTFQNEVEDRLSEALLEGKISRGDDVRVTAPKDAQKLTFSKAKKKSTGNKKASVIR
ncbi:ATP-dependent Clp protease ATP-binding subunit ClpC [[Clostridium] aminophilum]|uniref:ATP-dependent Clp protease ATP-binding subunit ClpC n=1 Tax=[Clostridium] aminophilum TaxID=1526 RepID=A0A1I0DSG0_9FIRM|nr:ATP-dependent Clp protease ATP-binding subunit [[Clostridium] aminophilum]SET35357.1 ATP-dependent Clp protease ATP-binding subunit ClpC [[Clostridium] aminophilum]